jgi:hypothetical protein
MSIHKIDIPPFVLANFYPNSLVVLPEEMPLTKEKNSISVEAPTSIANTSLLPELTTVAEPENNTIAIKYLGNNAQQICIVVQQANQVHISEESLALLTKMLSACKLTLNDVAIVNTATNAVTIHLLQEQLQVKKLLLFQVSTQQLNIPFAIPNYKLQSYNGYTVVQAVALEQMLGETAAEKMEKKQLWQCLQQLFNL